MINKVESSADFIFELTHDLLLFEEQLDKELRSTTFATRKQKDNKLKKQKVKRLISKARGRHRYRLKFYNSGDVVNLRLKVRGHNHRTTEIRSCALCDGNNQLRFRDHRSKTSARYTVCICVSKYVLILDDLARTFGTQSNS